MTTVRERTLQQLHPVGALVGRPITFAAAIAVPIYALVMTSITSSELERPGLAGLAITLIIGASVMLVVASGPLRAPLTSRAAGAMVVLAVAAYLASAASTWGENRFVRDDWGPTAIGVLLLALVPYRPAKEIIVDSVLASIFTGFLSVLQAETLDVPLPTFVYVVISVAPILAISLGGVAFARAMVGGVERWRSEADSAVSAIAADGSGWIARSVQQDRVTILNRDVVPFFARILESASVSEADRAQARQISDSVRAIMLAEADRSWLDQAIAQAAADHGRALPTGRVVVLDPERVIHLIPADQRASVRAFLVALYGVEELDPESLRVHVTPDGDRVRLVLDADFDSADSAVRSQLAPYLAVMRIIFSDLHLDLAGSLLRLRFSYAQ